MLKIINDKRLITKVCTMYYIENVSQKAIANSLGLSRPTVSRLIANGKKLGIIEITIKNDPELEFLDLEEKLKGLLNLKEVILTPSTENRTEQYELIGKEAARLLERLLHDESTIGVGMGKSLHYLMKHLTTESLPDLSCVPLIAGTGRMRMKYQANTIAEELARNFSGKNYPFFAPARVRNEEIRQSFLKETSIRRVFDEIRKIDSALVEIGGVDKESSLETTELYNSKEIRDIRENEAVGEICLQFFDVHGSSSRFRNLNQVIGVNINLLRRLRNSVGVVCGKDKAKAALGAIRGGFINILVTDVACGEEIMVLSD